jgi:hypothetical protein
MAIQVIIPNGSRVEFSANPPSGKLQRKVIGAASAVDAVIAVRAATNALESTPFGILARSDIKVTHIAHDHYDVDVPYSKISNEPGEVSWDFDTTGATVHITNSKEEVGRFPPNDAPDQKGVIGVDGDQIHGTDIVIPALKMNYTFRHPEGEMTEAHARFLASITGTTNSTAFRGFDAGEVLFLGARGSDGTIAEASVTYQFAMSQNVTAANSLTFGDISNIVKKGHEVAWVKHMETTETGGSNDYAVRIPQFVYVNRVYDAIDMASALGFG